MTELTDAECDEIAEGIPFPRSWMEIRRFNRALIRAGAARERAEPVRGAEVNSRARMLYESETANDPTIHCNRFPAWSELSESERDRYRRRAYDAPIAPDAPQRTPQDYAIEHARYLATAAEHLLSKASDLHVSIIEEVQDAPDATREAYSEAFSGLEAAIYEFRKRADRVAPDAPTRQPCVGQCATPTICGDLGRCKRLPPEKQGEGDTAA